MSCQQSVRVRRHKPPGTRLENRDATLLGDENEPVDAEFKPVNPTDKDLRAIMHNKDPGAMRNKYLAVVKGTQLLHERENDYWLTGDSCWIAVGDFVLYIRRQLGDVVEIYEDRQGRFNPLLDEAVARAASP